MRGAIERSARNNEARRLRNESFRGAFGGRGVNPIIRGLSQTAASFEGDAIEQERQRLAPQLQEFGRQDQSALSAAIAATGASPERQAAFAALPRAAQEKIVAGTFGAPAKRQISQGAGGFKRFVDSGERVFPQTELKETSPLVNIEDKTESTRQIKSEERRSKIIDNVFAGADNARETSAQAATIEANLDSLVEGGGVTGPAFGLLTFLNNSGEQFGIKTDLSETSSLTAIEAASNALAVPLTKQLGVNPTDKDFAIIKSTVARAGTSMPANFALVDLTKQAAARNIGKEALIIDAEERGLNEVQIRRELNKFHKNNPLKPAIPLPSNPSDLKVGSRYTTKRGVFEFDGQNMKRIR